MAEEERSVVIALRHNESGTKDNFLFPMIPAAWKGRSRSVAEAEVTDPGEVDSVVKQLCKKVDMSRGGYYILQMGMVGGIPETVLGDIDRSKGWLSEK